MKPQCQRAILSTFTVEYDFHDSANQELLSAINGVKEYVLGGLSRGRFKCLANIQRCMYRCLMSKEGKDHALWLQVMLHSRSVH